MVRIFSSENNRILEYIDYCETDNCMILMDYKNYNSENCNHTHIEIHPSLILGALASCIYLP